MPNIYRILDANFNRAREALRVMEDAARFLLDDQTLCQEIKHLRHDLAAALGLLPADLLTAQRDTPGDVGTGVKTARELDRGSSFDVVVAAGKRLSEALRSLEEYGKVIGDGGGREKKAKGHRSTSQPKAGEFAGRIEALRYRGYEVERKLTLAMGTGRRGRVWKLCVLLSESLCPGGDWMKVARAATEAAADCIQLREKSMEGGELLRRARELVRWCRPLGVSVIINDRPDVALAAGADGVHVGQGDLPCREIRRLFGRQLLVGVSTSCVEDARRAREEGADYCGVGPMFVTTTKDKKVIVGPSYLKAYRQAFPDLPCLAIGGIHAGNVRELVQAGVQGVAVSSAVCCAKDAGKAAAEILQAMGKTKEKLEDKR